MGTWLGIFKKPNKLKKKKLQTYYLDNSVGIRKVVFYFPYTNIFIFDVLEKANCSLKDSQTMISAEDFLCLYSSQKSHSYETHKDTVYLHISISS